MNLVANSDMMEITRFDGGVSSVRVGDVYLIEHSKSAHRPSLVHIRNHGAIEVSRQEAMNIERESGCALC